MRIFVASATWLSLGCSAEAPRAPVPPPSPAAPVSTPVAVLHTGVSSIGQMPADTTKRKTPCPGDTTEAAAILRAEGRVSRTGCELRVQLISGSTTIYESDADKYLWIRYGGYLKPMHAHVIHMFGIEGSGSRLIVDDSTGDSVRVWGEPIISPDGTRFVLTSMHGMADYDLNLIQIWRVAARKPEKEFSIDPVGYEPSNAVWRDSVTIDFIKYTYVGIAHPDSLYRKTPARLLRTGGRWVVIDP